MAIKFVKLRCKKYDTSGNIVSTKEYDIYPGDFLNINVTVLDDLTGVSNDVTVAMISLVEGEGAIRDDMDSFLESIIPDDDEWNIDDAKA